MKKNNLSGDRASELERVRKIRELNPNIDSEWHEIHFPEDSEDVSSLIDSCETFVELVTKYGNRENMQNKNIQT
jgi:RNA processing factor Prp31